MASYSPYLLCQLLLSGFRDNFRAIRNLTIHKLPVLVREVEMKSDGDPQLHPDDVQSIIVDRYLTTGGCHGSAPGPQS
jgi:hypothetical protein